MDYSEIAFNLLMQGDDDWCHLAPTLVWLHFLSVMSVLRPVLWMDQHVRQEAVTF